MLNESCVLLACLLVFYFSKLLALIYGSLLGVLLPGSLRSTPLVQNQGMADHQFRSRLQGKEAAFPLEVVALMNEEYTTSWELQGGSRPAAAFATVKFQSWLVDTGDLGHLYSSGFSTKSSNADTGWFVVPYSEHSGVGNFCWLFFTLEDSPKATQLNQNARGRVNAIVSSFHILTMAKQAMIM